MHDDERGRLTDAYSREIRLCLGLDEGYEHGDDDLGAMSAALVVVAAEIALKQCDLPIDRHTVGNVSNAMLGAMEGAGVCLLYRQAVEQITGGDDGD
jgi:hypothetical protein